jgi:hypothetical protein
VTINNDKDFGEIIMYRFSQPAQYLLLSLLLTPGLVLGGSSANFRINFDALDGGGGPSLSTNYQLRASSVNPHALGNTATSSYSVYTGLVSLPDTDMDAIVDPFDNCLFIANMIQTDADGDRLGDSCDPFPNNIDGDSDGLVDGADGIVLVGNYSSGVDADSDGFVDGEQDYSTNATKSDSDSDGFSDGMEVYYNSDPLQSSNTPATGDVNEDGFVNVVDVYLVIRHVLGALVLDGYQLVRADVAPINGLGIPVPDGNINVGDLVRIQRMAIAP